MINLRFRCSNCGSRLTDFVVTAKEATGGRGDQAPGGRIMRATRSAGRVLR
jgi:hypothetical protein